MNLVKSKISTAVFGLLFTFFSASAQEHSEIHSNESSHFDKKGKFRVTIGIDHENLKKRYEEKEHQIWAPAFALDIAYWVTQKIGIGLNTDLLLETSELNDDHEKEYPVSIVPVVYYEPFKNVAVFTGYGWELGKEDLDIFRIGAEYEKQLFKDYFMGAAFLYDFKNKQNNSLAYGFTIGRYF